VGSLLPSNAEPAQGSYKPVFLANFLLVDHITHYQ
jgi:hypothetical protein